MGYYYYYFLFLFARCPCSILIVFSPIFLDIKYDFQTFLHKIKLTLVTLLQMKCRRSHLGCSMKKVFLKLLQNLQENTSARVSFLIKLQASTLLKMRPWHKCFPVNFAKFLRTLFFIKHLRTTASESRLNASLTCYSNKMFEKHFKVWAK